MSSASTGIEWTNATWNPIRGCSRVSEGCRNCYAERTAVRQVSGAYRGLVKSTAAGPRWTGEVRFVEHLLDQPLRWRDGRRIFVNSMSDLFHEKVEDYWQDQIFAVMALAGQHTFQVLTKRPERMLAYLNDEDVRARIDVFIEEMAFERSDPHARRRDDLRATAPDLDETWPLPNVHLGVSVEDQATADARIPLLLQTPAAVRWVSYEPALSAVDFDRWIAPMNGECKAHRGYNCGICRPRLDGAGLRWIVIGGESGPGARPFDVAWARATIAQCRAAGVPVFMKQLGAAPFASVIRDDGDNWPGPIAWSGDGLGTYRPRLRDRKGGDWDEWPADLRVREFPTPSAPHA
jgi:protein gp37